MKGQKRYPKPNDFTPEKYFPKDHKTWPGKPRCTAWNSNHGRQCKKPARIGRTKCARCGGNTPRGLANPNTKTGRWSKDLPTRLKARYEQGLDDEDLAEVKHEIALIDSRIAELLQKVDTGEAGERWNDVGKLLESYGKAAAKYQGAVYKKDFNLMGDAFLEMDTAIKSIAEIVNGALGDYSTWEEINKWIEGRRRLVETKQKQDHLKEQTILVSEVILMFGALIGEFQAAMQKQIDQRASRLILNQVDGWVEKNLNQAGLVIEETTGSD